MRLISSVFALALTTSAALAGAVGPLPAGGPAGVKHAQEHDNTILYIALGVAAVAGIAIAVSQGDDDATPAPPVTTTATA
jgi:hypothetical protein